MKRVVVVVGGGSSSSSEVRQKILKNKLERYVDRNEMKNIEMEFDVL